MPPVLLAGGSDRSLLAAARSYAANDIPFLVVGVERGTVVGSSRAVRGRLAGVGPRARTEPDAYGEFIRDVARRHGVGVVLPLTDSTMLACDGARDELEADAKLALPSSRAVRNVLDKRANLDTARRLGIPCADEFELHDLGQIPELVETLGFPMVLKNPGPSVDGLRPTFGFSWLVARDLAELNDFLSRYCTSGAYPLFQRLVTGAVRNVCCFAVGGEIVAVHEYVSLRRVGGLSVLRELTPLSRELYGYAEAMLGDLEWDGAAHLGFFVRESDGDVRYMETNGRFWASIEGSIAAGWDFPLWTYRYFGLGQRPQAPSPATGVGLRWRWHYGELEALVRFLGGERQATWVGRSRTRAIRDYLRGFVIHADVFRRDDPMPELVEHWGAGRAAAGSLLRRTCRKVLPAPILARLRRRHGSGRVTAS